MFDPLDVPGYDVLAPLGRTGRTWKAMAVGDRSRVVLRLVHGSDETRRRLRQRSALWGSLPGGHVVPVRDVFSVGPDAAVVVSDYAPGGGLDALVARRGSLDDGEIITLVVPLAETLADAHRRGLVHGRVSAGNIVFGEGGRPMLTDAVLAGSGADTVGADVAALVSVATTAFGDRRVGAVHVVLSSPVASAAELAAALRAAAPARALSLHEPDTPAGEPPMEQTQRRSRRPFVATGAIVVVALVAGVLWGRDDNARAMRLPVPVTTVPKIDATPAPIERTTPTTAPRPVPGAGGLWWRVVQRLEQERVHTYTAALARSGLRPVGLRLRLQSVRLVTATRDRAVIRVIDGWASYELVRDDGHVAGHRPAQVGRAVTLVLGRTASGWQVQRVVR